jgi:PAS domain S-box-containing protein
MKKATFVPADPVQENLGKTHDLLINTLETMTDGFVSLDKNWNYTYINRRAAEMFGRKAEDLIGKHIWSEFPEGIGQKFYHNYQRAVTEQKPIIMEEYYPPWNRWFENRIYPTSDGLSIFFQEITERKRAEELSNGQKQLHEMISTGKPFLETLTALVRFIESQAPEVICTILLLDEDSMTVRHAAAPSLPVEIIRAIDGSTIGPRAGSCGTAAYLSKNVFVEDIAKDPLWDGYRQIYLPHGLRACWSSPIFDNQRCVLGTFAIYYRTPGLPTSFHLQLIEIATHIASISITRHRAEEILRRREQQLALIYSTVSDIMFLLEVQPGERYRVISVNPAFLIATGLTSDQVDGKFVEEIIPATAHDLVFSSYRKAIAEKRMVQWEEISEYPAGRKAAIVRVSPIFDDHGVCTHLVGAINDITEFYEAEEAVRKSQVELEHVFKTAPVGLALLDENLHFLRINEELAAIHGKSAEEHIGKSANELLPGFPPEIEDNYRRVLETGQPIVDLEIRGTSPAQAGVERTWLASYYPVKSSEGTVRGVGVVVVDVTDRAAIAQLGQLAVTDTDLTMLFDLALELVATTLNTEYVTVLELLPDGTNLFPRASFGWKTPLFRVNAKRESQGGFTIQSGEPVIVEDVRSERRFDVPYFMLDEGIISCISVLIPCKKGPYGTLEAHTLKRREFPPDQVHFVQSIANILGAFIERKQLQEQIFQAQKLELIGGLAAGVAHQLNTPLAVIMMRLQMLKEDLGSDSNESSLAQIESIVNSAKKMSTIIQELLNFSRIPKQEKQSFHLEELIKQTLHFVEVRIRKQNVQIEQNFSGELPLLHADKNRLEQALLNIVVNALDAMSDGGILSVTTKRIRQSEIDYACIDFHDTGMGMSPEQAEKVFDPFFTTKPAGEGTGLGLSVTYEIIRNHRGQVTVESKPGEGSTFHVLLPLPESSS